MSLKRASDFSLSSVDLDRIASSYGATQLDSIGGFENALFRSDDSSIVRVTHRSRRSPDLIGGELGFMNLLAESGVSVPQPIPTARGEPMLEMTTESGEPVIVMAMTEAKGAHKRAADWSDEDIESYGELLASMHRAAMTVETGGARRRPAWHDPVFEPGILDDREADPEFVSRYHEIMADAQSSSAGGVDMLIHQDAHLGNLFIDDHGSLTVFDFDDCAYGTPTHDVAIVLFYWVFVTEADPAVEARRFLDRFFTGYSRHSSLPSDWPVGADHFLSLREIEILWLVQQEPPEERSKYDRRFMEGRLGRILDGVPYLGSLLADIMS